MTTKPRTADTPSRRAMIGALAALPIASVPAVAGIAGASPLRGLIDVAIVDLTVDCGAAALPGAHRPIYWCEADPIRPRQPISLGCCNRRSQIPNPHDLLLAHCVPPSTKSKVRFNGLISQNDANFGAQACRDQGREARKRKVWPTGTFVRFFGELIGKAPYVCAAQ
jgi:hypothetical protein